MADNSSLGAAKTAKNDEFYTQYSDIEAEMNAYVEYNPDVFRDKTILLPCDDPEWSQFTRYFAANFERFGLKKLISTSYAKGAGNRQLTLFEAESPLYDEEKHDTHGKLFVLTRDADGSGNIDIDDVEFTGYLEGDGDFRSLEVKKLRDEADIIITNPPFSLFREFLTWIMEGKKQFVILGNMNAITYKEVFPLLKENKVWLGYKSLNNDMYFNVTDEYKQWLLENKKEGSAYKIINGVVMGRLASACWFTNLDHGKRYEPLLLDTMEHNLKFNKKLKKKLERDFGMSDYPRYDNYDAIEVPFTECIPSDYEPGYLVPIKYRQQLEKAGFILGGQRANSSGQMCVCVCGQDLIAEDCAAEPDGALQRGDGRADNVSGQIQSQTIRDSGNDGALVIHAEQALPPRRISRSERHERNLDSHDPAWIPERLQKIVDSPCDAEWCNGVMGVPITFLDKYNPVQFEIMGMCENEDLYGLKTRRYTTQECRDRYFELFHQPGTYDLNAAGVINGKKVYQRILIKQKREQ